MNEITRDVTTFSHLLANAAVKPMPTLYRSLTYLHTNLKKLHVLRVLPR